MIAPTFTVTESDAVTPVEDVQVSVYDFAAVRFPVDSAPLGTLFAPVQEPTAEHDCELVEIQESNALVPYGILIGPSLLFALRSIAGTTTGEAVGVDVGVGEAVGVAVDIGVAVAVGVGEAKAVKLTQEYMPAGRYHPLSRAPLEL